MPPQYTMIFLHGENDEAKTNLDLFLHYGLCPRNCRVVLANAPKGKWYENIEEPKIYTDLYPDQLRSTID